MSFTDLGFEVAVRALWTSLVGPLGLGLFSYDGGFEGANRCENVSEGLIHVDDGAVGCTLLDLEISKITAATERVDQMKYHTT